MPERYIKWDVTDYLESKEVVCYYLEAAAEEDPRDGSEIRSAYNNVVRAQKMGRLPGDVDLSCAGLLRALFEVGDISPETITQIAAALNKEHSLSA